MSSSSTSSSPSTTTATTTTFQVRSRVLGDAPPPLESIINNRRSHNIVTNCDDLRDGVMDDCTAASSRSPHIRFDPLTQIPMEYTCQLSLEDSSVTTTNDDDDSWAETWVRVDYEALLPVTADARSNERQLQWRVLLAAVEEVGLDRCDFTKQQQRRDDEDGGGGETDTITSTPPRLRRRRRQLSVGLPSNLTIYAIENDLASSFAFPIPCQHLATTEDMEDVQCLPVRTVLKLKYYSVHPQPANATATNETGPDMDTQRHDEEGLVQAHVQNLLQNSLEYRTNSLYVGDVMGLYYVGTHNLEAMYDEDNPIGGKDHVAASGNHHPDDHSMIRIGSLVSAASAVVLLLFLFVVRRRRRTSEDLNSNKPATSPEAIIQVEEDNLSMQLPLDMMQDETLERDWGGITSSSSSSSSSSSPTAGEAAFHDDSSSSQRDPPLRHDRTLLYDTTAATTLQADIVQKEHDLMVDNDIASIFRSSSSDLPPRPPHSSSARGVATIATTSRRRRKKKKRRKRPTLQRVNSREGIHTMEAIPEVFSGDDDDDDDKGSDYYDSSCEEEETEEEASRASSSGYNTPVGPEDDENASPRTRQRFPSDPDSADAQRLLETLQYHLATATNTTEEEEEDIQRSTTLKTSNKATAVAPSTRSSSSSSSPQGSSNSLGRSFRSAWSSGWFES